MAKRTIFSRRFGKCKASIRYDSGLKEYEYGVVGPTKKSPWTGTGFSDDKKDARASLADMIRRMHKAGVCKPTASLGGAHKRKKARLRRRAAAAARLIDPAVSAQARAICQGEERDYAEWYKDLSPAGQARADADPDLYERLLATCGTRRK